MKLFSIVSCKALVIVLVMPFFTSCLDEEETKTTQEHKDYIARKALREHKAAELARKKQEALEAGERNSQREAKEAAELAMKLEKERQQEEAEQKIAAEKERIKQEKILARQLVQEKACNTYKGTSYEELVLIDGRILTSAKVTDATPLGVHFIHQNGAARIPYSNLPKDIVDTCLYDEELADIELERQMLSKQKHRQEIIALQAKKNLAASNDKKSTNSLKTSRPSYSGSSSYSKKEEPIAVKPKGKLSARVVGMKKGRKKVEIKAMSNVDATITLSKVYVSYSWITKTYNVKAKELFSIVVEDVNVKYDVTLKGGGKTLDTESSGRKSGLGVRKGF